MLGGPLDLFVICRSPLLVAEQEKTTNGVAGVAQVCAKIAHADR